MDYRNDIHFTQINKDGQIFHFTVTPNVKIYLNVIHFSQATQSLSLHTLLYTAQTPKPTHMHT